MRAANSQRPIEILVAGVPRSYQGDRPGGQWLTAAHRATIAAVSDRVRLTHVSRDEIEAGDPASPPDIVLVEMGNDPWYRDEIPPAAFARLLTPSLAWIQTCSSGVGHFLEHGSIPDDVLLTNAAGVHADALGESVIAAVMIHAKRLEARFSNHRERRWEELHCEELGGKTMCVIGTGHIGRAAAARARCFGMRVLGVRRRAGAAPGFDETRDVTRLGECLREADYVVVACPLTAETEGLLDAAALNRCKPGAYVINVSRGKIIAADALIGAVQRGHLSGAYLDAHAEEPLPADHPFWSTPGILVIPHDSHSSPRIGDNIVDLFCGNLARYLDGEPLRNKVDRLRGY